MSDPYFQQAEYLGERLADIEKQMIDPRDFGRLEGEVKALQTQMTELDRKVSTLIELASQGKGGIRTLWAVGGAIATVIGWLGVEKILK